MKNMVYRLFEGVVMAFFAIFRVMASSEQRMVGFYY